LGDGRPIRSEARETVDASMTAVTRNREPPKDGAVTGGTRNLIMNAFTQC
jgi:hypothetical protein